MPLFKWNDSYSVGVELLDDDHKKLIGYLNEVFELVTTKKSKEEIVPILEGLKLYTVTHFNNEEKLFEKYGYPDTEAHKKEHSDFIEKVEDFYEEYNTGDLMLTIDVMNFLKSWLKTHITGTDKKYKDFLNSKGVF